jgi:hypothetical protein
MADTQVLTSTFTAAHNDAVSTTPPAGAAAPHLAEVQALGTEFCTIWPKARPALDSVVAVIGFIPGVASAIPVLRGLMAVGDALQKEECGSP